MNLLALGIIEKGLAIIVSLIGGYFGYRKWHEGKLKEALEEQEKREKRIKQHIQELIEDEIEQSEKRMINNIQGILHKTFIPLSGELIEIKNLIHDLEDKYEDCN